MATGVLPKQMLHELTRVGNISGISENYLNPASIDLPLSEEAYRVEGVSLPGHGMKVRDMFASLGAVPHDLQHPLEAGVSYLIRIEGGWHLPSSVYGYVNPKSSTGRIFTLSRVIADNVDMYDALVGTGWEGEMWVLVRPEKFPIRVHPGIALSQVRLFDGKGFLDELATELAIKEHGLLFTEKGKKLVHPRNHADSLFLTLAVKGMMGWECRGTTKVLDLAKIGAHDPLDFFVPIKARDGMYRLRKDGCYILTTKERVMVPPDYSAELRAIDPRFGEFRSHAAGFIDPGWGWGKHGEVCGRPITLELTMFEDFIVADGQNIARIRYERMKETPEVLYDSAASNYTVQQRAKLAKFFKS